MAGGTTQSDLATANSWSNEQNKQKQTLSAKVEAQQKRCASTRLDYGALKMLSRVKMNGAKNAPPLTAFSTRYPRLSFFSLTGAVVVIDRMTRRVRYLAKPGDFQGPQHAYRRDSMISSRVAFGGRTTASGNFAKGWSIM